MQILVSMLGPIFFYGMCFSAGVQILYYLILFRRFAAHKQKEVNWDDDLPQQGNSDSNQNVDERKSNVAGPKSDRSGSEGSPTEGVSVIVCARDEAENIQKNLPGVLVQEYPMQHEVLLVDDNSADETKYLIEQFLQTFPGLKYLGLKQEAKLIVGKKFPLSMGIKTARYEKVLLTDADCVPASEHWAKWMFRAFNEKVDIVLGYGAYHKRPGMLNKLVRFETFHSALQYFSFALAGMPYMGVGRNLSYRKSVFMKNKGFSSINMIPSGDDDLFINQVATAKNTAIVYHPDSHTLSEAKSNFSDWVRQKYRHYSTTKYYKKKHRFWLGLYSVSFALVYALGFLSLLFYPPWQPFCVLGAKWFVQGFVFYFAMKKLNEKDLFPFFILFDIWMYIYYIISMPALWLKPKMKWN